MVKEGEGKEELNTKSTMTKPQFQVNIRFCIPMAGITSLYI